MKRSNRSMSWNTWDILMALFLVLCVFSWNNMASQRAKKVVSNSPGLVDFAIGLVNSVINLPDGQVNFFEEFNLQKNCEINLLIKTFCGQVEMIFGLVVNVSFSLPEWCQAVKMTFFAPCIYSGKFPLKTPGNAISETLYFKISLDASALKNLCLWCEFQSRLLFLISLLLKNLLTALRQTYLQHIYYQPVHF